MLRKSLFALVAVMLFGAAFAAPAHAQSQAVSLNIGYFSVRGLDARATTDIAANELLLGGDIDRLDYPFRNGIGCIANGDSAASCLKQAFNNVTFGGEWLIGIGDYLEGGVGVAYYSSGNVPSVSANFLNTDGSEITQTLKLRVVPITATLRFLPIGHRGVVEPYIGGGLGVFIWRYSEVGQFLDSDQNIFAATFNSSGTKVGPVVVGGVRVPVGAYAVGFEVRYQRAEGDLGSTFAPFATTVDLGGITYQATFVVRFGGR